MSSLKESTSEGGQQFAGMNVNGLPKERTPDMNSTKLSVGSDAHSFIQNGENVSTMMENLKSTMVENLKKLYNNLHGFPNLNAEEMQKSMTNNMSTENLLSILEDEKQEEAQPTKTATSTILNKSITRTPKPTANVAAAPTTKLTKYLYKLKSKSGRVLRYTSDVPITLKKPIITLIRQDEETIRASYEKEQRKNTAIRKRSRTKKNSQEVSVAESEMDGAAEGIRTRKRKLKFLPDGTFATSEKLARMADSEGEESESARSAAETSDDDYVEQPDKRKRSNAAAIESKRNSSIVEGKANQTSSNQVTPKAPSVNTLSPPVNASRLLSSFLGITILPSQLTVTRFKPKNFNEKIRSVNVEAARKITLAELKNVVTNNASISSIAKATPSLATPSPIESKPVRPVRIEPNPAVPAAAEPKPPSLVAAPPATPIIRQEPLAVPSAPVVQTTTTKLAPQLCETQPVPGSLQNILAKFDDFSDSRVVKTREGPRRKITDESASAVSEKTLYELFYDVFEALPTWNLHVIPDNNSFCIAQISRGQMGMPVLKKSIELNSDFFAKVYVHQLHCKRYDGIYDTEEKIISLIKEIDSLAS